MDFRVPGKILEEYTTPNPGYKARSNRLGLVQFGDAHRPVILDLVPEAHVGDYVRVHVGFAVQCVPEDEARREYEALKANGHWRTMERDIEADEAQPDMVRRQKQV